MESRTGIIKSQTVAVKVGIATRRPGQSIVRQLGPTNIKRTVKEYCMLYRSKRKMKKRLTAKPIRSAMNQLEKGKKVSVVAAELKVTPRHIRRLRAEFRETGSVHVPCLPGRPTLQPPSQEEVQMVLDAYQLEKVGVLRTAISLRRAGHNISYQRVYRIMKENGLVVPRLVRNSSKSRTTNLKIFTLHRFNPDAACFKH